MCRERTFSLPTSAFSKFATCALSVHFRLHLPFGLDRRTAHPRYAFASYVLFLVVGNVHVAIAIHTVLCGGHYCKFSLPSMYLSPFPLIRLLVKNEDIFIGGGHVMSHSQLAYVLEFSHARIQLVHTLISTFLS